MESEVYTNPNEGQMLKDWWQSEGKDLVRDYNLNGAIVTGSGDAYVTIERNDYDYSYDEMDSIVIEVADSMESYGLPDVGYSL